MMAITTSSSISVNADRRLVEVRMPRPSFHVVVGARRRSRRRPSAEPAAPRSRAIDPGSGTGVHTRVTPLPAVAGAVENSPTDDQAELSITNAVAPLGLV